MPAFIGGPHGPIFSLLSRTAIHRSQHMSLSLSSRTLTRPHMPASQHASLCLSRPRPCTPHDSHVSLSMHALPFLYEPFLQVRCRRHFALSRKSLREFRSLDCTPLLVSCSPRLSQNGRQNAERIR